MRKDSSSEIERERLLDIQIFSSKARNVVRELCIFSGLSSPRTFLSFFSADEPFLSYRCCLRYQLSLSLPSVVIRVPYQFGQFVVLAAIAAPGGGTYVFGK